VNFGSISKAFWDHWVEDLPLTTDSVGKNPATVSKCDWRETQDMVDFQAFVGTIKVKDGWPDVASRGIPLSAMIVAHHNLVTYGVPFMNDEGKWTNPGPQKTFYTPAKAIESLAKRLDLMSNNTVATDWVRSGPTLDGGNVPGMAAWVEKAREMEWDMPKNMEKRKEWTQFHELSDSD